MSTSPRLVVIHSTRTHRCPSCMIAATMQKLSFVRSTLHVHPSLLRRFKNISSVKQFARTITSSSVTRANGTAGEDPWNTSTFPAATSSLPKLNEPPEYTIEIPRQDRSKESIEAKRARLIYSSRHRGILETDLILGTFAQKHLNRFNAKELQEYDVLLEENDWDIYYWCTKGRVPPERIRNMTIWNALVEHAENRDRKAVRMPVL